MCPSMKLSLNSGVPLANPMMYLSVIGALQWLTMTRPDISFALNRLSQFLKSPTTDHWMACKRILRYLSSSPTKALTFASGSLLDLQAFSDADWAGCLDDRKSTSGYVVYLGGNLLSWSSKKQNVIAQFSTKSEYRSLAHAASELIWIQSILTELELPVSTCPVFDRLALAYVSGSFFSQISPLSVYFSVVLCLIFFVCRY